ARLDGVNHPLVVHNLMPDVDRRAVFIECALDNLYRAHNSGAETARFRQNDLHRADPLNCPFIALTCRRWCARSARNAISAGCNCVLRTDPKSRKAFMTTPRRREQPVSY